MVGFGVGAGMGAAVVGAAVGALVGAAVGLPQSTQLIPYVSLASRAVIQTALESQLSESTAHDVACVVVS